MSGIEAYEDRYDRMSRNIISKSQKEWMLEGFYNSLLINKSYTTAHLYLHYVKKFLENVDNINDISVDDYYKYLASKKKQSSSAQIDCYHALQKYSKYLNSKGVCDDYMRFVERPKFIETQETKDKREKGYLTKAETKIMFTQIDVGYGVNKRSDCWKKRDETILRIFLNTGIRCAALSKLDVNNVDLENNTITVFEKGSKPKRINISDSTRDCINEWLEYRNELLMDYIDDNALIISIRRERLKTIGIYEVICKMGRNITGKKITPHKLRATYISQLYENTNDVYFVQECAGHSSPKTTELYIRGQKGNMSKKASDIMSGFLK